MGIPYLVDRQGRKFELRTGRPVIIGRDPRMDFPVEDESISRRHAAIAFENGAFSITDLNSSNGTSVNGSRAGGAPSALQDGDSIRLGSVSFTFHRVATAEANTANAQTAPISAGSTYSDRSNGPAATKLKVCPKCSRPASSPSANFCTRCQGVRLVEIIDPASLTRPDQFAGTERQHCPQCGQPVTAAEDVFCKKCGARLLGQQHIVQVNSQINLRTGEGSSSQVFLLYESQKKQGWLAALLNWIIPGTGYAYCGRVILGILVFILDVFLWILTIGSLGLGLPILIVFHIVFIIDGFLCASRFNKKLMMSLLAGRLQ